MANDTNNFRSTVSRDTLIGYAVAMQDVMEKMNVISKELKDKKLDNSIGYPVIFNFVETSYNKTIDHLKQSGLDVVE